MRKFVEKTLLPCFVLCLNSKVVVTTNSIIVSGLSWTSKTSSSSSTI